MFFFRIQLQANPSTDISFRVITNDGSDQNSQDLIALKKIISRQLPKMPKDYIVRLVFDRRHVSVVICKGVSIIGGICYRPYIEQRFGEIAFCAIDGTEQVRGYGTMLMNNTKNYAQKESESALYVAFHCSLLHLHFWHSYDS